MHEADGTGGFPGFYDFYRAGRFNGRGPELMMFRYYRPDGSFGSCSCIEIQEAAATRNAIRQQGWRPLVECRR